MAVAYKSICIPLLNLNILVIISGLLVMKYILLANFKKINGLINCYSLTL